MDLKRFRLSGKKPIPKGYICKEMRNVDQIHSYQGLGTSRGREVHREEEMGMVTNNMRDPCSEVLYFDCGSEYTKLDVTILYWH